MWKKIFERKPQKKHPYEGKPRSEEEREQQEFEERFANLSKDEQRVYKSALECRAFLEEHRELWKGPKNLYRSKDEVVQALESHDKRWSRFALSMLEGAHAQLTEYAGNPASFAAIAERFAIDSFISTASTAHMTGRRYGERSSYLIDPVSKDGIYFDAPFGYAVRYRRDDGEWETVSVLSFIPDFQKNILYVDQVQGGNTARGRSSEEARKARYKFERPPLVTLETVVYGIVRELARRTCMQEIALRKGKHNRWFAVNEKAKNAATVYERIALLYGMQNTPEETYYRDQLAVH